MATASKGNDEFWKACSGSEIRVSDLDFGEAEPPRSWRRFYFVAFRSSYPSAGCSPAEPASVWLDGGSLPTGPVNAIEDHWSSLTLQPKTVENHPHVLEKKPEENALFVFGHSRNRRSPTITKDQYVFVQKETDYESQLQYFDARFYISTLARFLTTDPLLQQVDNNSLLKPQDLNVYAYCNSESVSEKS
jgi:RHS repeat-associated protein